MKKKRAAIILCAAVMLIAAAAAVLMHGKSIDTARCIVADNGTCIWARGSNGAIVMRGDDGMFSSVTTGDKVLIIHDNQIEEIYPGQVRVYFCIKLEDGSREDIPESTLSSLSELGWI